MLYIFIALLIFFLSYYYDIIGCKRNKDLWYKIVLFILICLAGMRWRIGVDSTHEIYEFYHNNFLIQNFYNNISLTEYPLWKLLNSFIYSIGGKFFWVQFIQATIVNLLIFKYIKKHSKYVFMCLFFLFIWKYRVYCFEEMKASFGVVLCLYANDFILEKKYLKSLFLYTIGFFFHPSIALVGLMSQMIFLRMNLSGVLFLFFGLFIGNYLKNNAEGFLFFFSTDDFIASKVESYIEHDTLFAITGKNLNYFIAYFGPMLVYSIGSFFYVKKYIRSNLLQLEPFLVITLFFVILNSNVMIFYRFVNIYAIYMILFISQAFVDFTKHSKKLLITSLLFVPFFFYIWSTYFGLTGKDPTYRRFYPYSSVIERKIDREREKVFNQNRIAPPPNPNEY